MRFSDDALYTCNDVPWDSSPPPMFYQSDNGYFPNVADDSYYLQSDFFDMWYPNPNPNVLTPVACYDTRQRTFDPYRQVDLFKVIGYLVLNVLLIVSFLRLSIM